MDPLIGQVQVFGVNFAPQGWALCNGQRLAIPQNQALFSLPDTTYGGNGVNPYDLPDLRSRVPLGHGQGPGLNYYQIGGGTGSNEKVVNSYGAPPDASASAQAIGMAGGQWYANSGDAFCP